MKLFFTIELTNEEITHESRKITIHINLDSLLDTWSIYRKNVVPISREEEDFIKETIIFKTSITVSEVIEWEVKK